MTSQKVRRYSDFQLSKIVGPRPLTPRQLRVLQEYAKGGTQWDAYIRILDNDPTWTIHKKFTDRRRKPFSYNLTFVNFRQHIANAYGRLGVHNRQDAFAAIADL